MKGSRSVFRREIISGNINERSVLMYLRFFLCALHGGAALIWPKRFCLGAVSNAWRSVYLDIIDEIDAQMAEAVVSGRTGGRHACRSVCNTLSNGLEQYG